MAVSDFTCDASAIVCSWRRSSGHTRLLTLELGDVLEVGCGLWQAVETHRLRIDKLVDYTASPDRWYVHYTVMWDAVQPLKRIRARVQVEQTGLMPVRTLLNSWTGVWVNE